MTFLKRISPQATAAFFLLLLLFFPLASDGQKPDRRLVIRKIADLNKKRLKAEKNKDYEQAVRYCWEIAESYRTLEGSGLVESFYRRAIINAQRKGDKFLEGRSYEKLADTYPTLKYYSKKKESYQSALDLYQLAGSSEREGIIFRKQAKISHEMRDYFYAIDAIEKLLANEQAYQLSKNERENFYKILIEGYSKRGDAERVKLYDGLLESSLADQEEKKNKNKAKIESEALIDESLLSEREVEILRVQKRQLVRDTALQALAIRVKNDSIKLQQDSLEIADLKNKEKDALAKKYEAERQTLFFVSLSVLAVFVLAVVAYVNKRKSAQRLAQKNIEIEAERKKSDALLLNILPEETAQELKENGEAKPKNYTQVSVLFTDFKGFTQISEQLSPQAIIQELNECFKAFDEICQQYNLEKIKTIGDAYMCAAGVPIPNQTNALDAVRAGLAMQAFMREWKAKKIANNEPIFELRLGIHTGAVVAGVVGNYKFAYDIWGDTVNTASRMESSGEIGKVNISGATYELVKDHFICTHRGKIAAKNKGDIDMYFVEAEK
ncbi:adenylate/guanylate cyclase domain-containing protein [Hugenholtzia roseola]|uniref:adenylate/guanylate cyclase domain-containing protein n=1 Tax=Hugenholtzia roseola TaxID=1002 RepID=UPI0003FAA93E|nr:adenylate/guanylate cyclase domain-containing protein [Hugenholtzia roseola]